MELRRFENVAKIPKAEAIYRFLSRFDEKQFVNFVSGVLDAFRWAGLVSDRKYISGQRMAILRGKVSHVKSQKPLFR
jgi:hypothetical protein